MSAPSGSLRVTWWLPECGQPGAAREEMDAEVTPEVTAGLFTLAGAAVGFTAAVIAEFMRSRGSSSRELADRRRNLQVETLIQIQEVAERLYDSAGRDWAHYEGGRAKRPPEEELAHRERQVGAMSRMQMLAYRVHHPLIREMALSLMAACAIQSTTEKDEAERRRHQAQVSYHALQEASGAEMLLILGYRRPKSRREWRRNPTLPFPDELRRAKDRADDAEPPPVEGAV